MVFENKGRVNMKSEKKQLQTIMDALFKHSASDILQLFESIDEAIRFLESIKDRNPGIKDRIEWIYYDKRKMEYFRNLEKLTQFECAILKLRVIKIAHCLETINLEYTSNTNKVGSYYPHSTEWSKVI